MHPSQPSEGFTRTSQREKPSKALGTQKTRIISSCSDDRFLSVVSSLLLVLATHPWHVQFFRMTFGVAVPGPGTELQRPLEFSAR